jgi:hypothetical protein
VASCSLPLDGMRIYNQRSRCVAKRGAYRARRPAFGEAGFLLLISSAARSCVGGRSRAATALACHAHRRHWFQVTRSADVL